ncbi:TPA: hypothetical protein U3P08_001935 [Streptococcus agalactiae]|nr:hypothetical protein [Streptococcus agalactiae]
MVKKYNKLSRKSVSTVGLSLAIASLEAKGYSVSKEGPYYRAYLNDEEPELLIYFAAKEFSYQSSKETTQFKVEDSAIEKMKNYAESSQDNFQLCIAYCLIKYEITDLEITIVPVEAIEKYAKVGGVYSRSSGKYYYNFDAIEKDELPNLAILRILWESDGFN